MRFPFGLSGRKALRFVRDVMLGQGREARLAHPALCGRLGAKGGQRRCLPAGGCLMRRGRPAWMSVGYGVLGEEDGLSGRRRCISRAFLVVVLCSERQGKRRKVRAWI